MRFAIVNDVRTNRKVKAICEVWTYDVWGNARSGWEVNDRYCQDRAREVEAVVVISNMPRLPGAFDQYRKFTGDSASFSCEMAVSFEIEDKTLCEIFGCKRIETDGDDTHIIVNRERDSYPLGELLIVGWKDENGDGPDPGDETIKPPKELPFGGSHAPDCPYRLKGECNCWRSDPEQNEELRTVRNYYKCVCGHEWTMEWNCACDDKCPKCNTAIQPHKSEDIG